MQTLSSRKGGTEGQAMVKVDDFYFHDLLSRIAYYPVTVWQTPNEILTKQHFPYLYVPDRGYRRQQPCPVARALVLTRTKFQPCQIFNIDHSAMSYVPSSPPSSSNVDCGQPAPLWSATWCLHPSWNLISSNNACGKWWKLAEMLIELKSVMTICSVAFSM